MHNLIQVFNFQSPAVHVAVVNDSPWFCLPDVCCVLNIKNPRRFITSKHLDNDAIKTSNAIASMGRKQSTNLINEPNLYCVTFHINKIEAKQFQGRVFNEALPQIRQHGIQQSVITFITDKGLSKLREISQEQAEYQPEKKHA